MPYDVGRSDRPEVRNPIRALPEYQVLLALPREQRAFAILHRGIARTSLANGQKCWAQNKGPMAVYWREAAASHRHIANALRRGL